MMDIDFTHLEKRGLLKKKLESTPSMVNNHGILDLSSSQSVVPNVPVQNNSTFDFLDSLASTAQHSNSPSTSLQSYSNNADLHSEISSMRQSIDALHSRLSDLISRFENIEMQLRYFRN